MSDVDGSASPIPSAELQPDHEPAQPVDPGTPARAERRLRFWNSGTWWWSAVVLVIAQATAMRVEGVPDLFNAFDMAAFLLDVLFFVLPWLLAGVVVRTIVLRQRRRKGHSAQELSTDQRLLGLAALALLLVAPTAATSLPQQITRSDDASASADGALAACDHVRIRLKTEGQAIAASKNGWSADSYDRLAAAFVHAHSLVTDPAERELADVLADYALNLTDMSTAISLGDYAAYRRADARIDLTHPRLEALCNPVLEAST